LSLFYSANEYNTLKCGSSKKLNIFDASNLALKDNLRGARRALQKGLTEAFEKGKIKAND
jgi:hypothetical protein